MYDTIKGVYGNLSFLELLLRLNYIMGLNLLPLVITVTLLLEYPYYNAFYGIEVLPFFFYLVTYTDCLKSSSFKIKNYLDGLSIGIFMNFHYLRGTWTSLQVLFKKQTTQVFKATPRTKTFYKTPINAFELFGLFFLVPYSLLRLQGNIDSMHYWDVYPVYILFCIVYGIQRLIGYRKFARNVIEILKIKS